MFKSVFRRGSFCLIALLALNTSQAQSKAVANKNGFVCAQGLDLIQAGGTPLHIKGINLGNCLNPEVRAAMNELLGNLLYANCAKNKGYISAPGMKP